SRILSVRWCCCVASLSRSLVSRSLANTGRQDLLPYRLVLLDRRQTSVKSDPPPRRDGVVGRGNNRTCQTAEDMTVVNIAMSPLRRRNCFLLLAFVVFIPFCLFVLFSAPDITSEQTLVQRLAELQVKIQYLDSMYRSRQEDLQQLVQRVELATPPGPASASENASSSTLTAPAVMGSTELRPEVRALLKNMSGMHAAHGVNPPYMLRYDR
ncbi:unnamed protein product, partial [Callosobruchus maculatus]